MQNPGRRLQLLYQAHVMAGQYYSQEIRLQLLQNKVMFLKIDGHMMFLKVDKKGIFLKFILANAY